MNTKSIDNNELIIKLYNVLNGWRQMDKCASDHWEFKEANSLLNKSAINWWDSVGEWAIPDYFKEANKAGYSTAYPLQTNVIVWIFINAVKTINHEHTI